MSKISVALCTYNGEKYLQHQLESIKNQTLGIHELIVCDDGSKDQAPLPVKEGGPNTNVQKIAEINRENITVTSRALIKGIACDNGVLDPISRYTTVTCITSVKSINAANDLARLSGNN